MEVETVIRVIEAIGGLGLIGGFYKLYTAKTEKKSLELNNDAKHSENDNIVIEQLKDCIVQLTDFNNKIKEMFEQELAIVRMSNDKKKEKIDSLIKEKEDLLKTIDEKNSEIAKLTVMKCEVKGCVNRMPPSGY